MIDSGPDLVQNEDEILFHVREELLSPSLVTLLLVVGQSIELLIVIADDIGEMLEVLLRTS